MHKYNLCLEALNSIKLYFHKMKGLYDHESAIIFIIPAIIEIVTFIVFCDLVRKRYRLYRDIRCIPSDLLYFETYQNYLKNIRIKSMIHNFIIIILYLELVNNTNYVIISLLNILWTNYRTLEKTLLDPENKLINFNYCLRMAFVPLLSLLMNILWVVYRKYQYRCTIIRWTVYIVMRVVCLYMFSLSLTRSYDYLAFLFVRGIVFTFLHVLDFIQFIYYSRKFYRHLKSKETEIRLFYFDQKAYFDIKFLRIHFKIATILVVIALFFFTVGFSLQFYVWISSPIIKMIWPDVNHRVFYWMSMISNIHSPFIVLYKLLFLFNYLYMVFLIVCKSLRDRKKLANINDAIKPIAKKFHHAYYNGLYRSYNYA